RLEPHREVQALGFLHEGQGVQQQTAIAELLRGRDDAFHQHAAEAASARGRNHIETLDLADFLGEPPYADASDVLAGVLGQDEGSARRSVFAREVLQLLLEVLEREVDVESRGVFAHEASRLRPFVRRRCLQQANWTVSLGRHALSGPAAASIELDRRAFYGA